MRHARHGGRSPRVETPRRDIAERPDRTVAVPHWPSKSPVVPQTVLDLRGGSRVAEGEQRVSVEVHARLSDAREERGSFEQGRVDKSL